MNAIAINDLEMNKDLGREAMQSLLGGWTYTGYSDAFGSWSRLSDTTTTSGYQYIGTVRYRVMNRRIRNQRTQIRSYNYKRLEFDGYI